MKDKFILKLYVTGQTPKAEKAISNFKKICENNLKGMCEFTIIDILEQPHLAEKAKILATPTLIKELPEPVRRIIGDLSQTEKVLSGLDLKS